MMKSAQSEIRTRTAVRPLDPEPSVSTSSTIWAQIAVKFIEYIFKQQV